MTDTLTKTTRITIIITIITMAITSIIIQIEIIIIRNSIIDPIIITMVTVILTIIGQVVQIIKLTDQTTRTEQTGGLTMCEPRTMVGEGDTTKDARVSVVTQTETMMGGTPGTKQGEVEATKTIDKQITRRTTISLETDPTEMEINHRTYRTDGMKSLNPL